MVHPEDAASNEHAVGNGRRIVSSYAIGSARPKEATGLLWIITEADRSSTTLLLPEEY